MSAKQVNSSSAYTFLVSCQSVLYEFKLKSVNRVHVLLICAEHEREFGYCSGMMLQRIVNRQSANVLIWLERSGYIERTGNWNKPRRLSPAGWQVVNAFAATCKRIAQEQANGEHRALPTRKRKASARNTRKAQTSHMRAQAQAHNTSE